MADSSVGASSGMSVMPRSSGLAGMQLRVSA